MPWSEDQEAGAGAADGKRDGQLVSLLVATVATQMDIKETHR